LTVVAVIAVLMLLGCLGGGLVVGASCHELICARTAWWNGRMWTPGPPCEGGRFIALRLVVLGEAYLQAGGIEEVVAEACRALEFVVVDGERNDHAGAVWLWGWKIPSHIAFRLDDRCAGYLSRPPSFAHTSSAAQAAGR
jgi:hypothetical protein